LSFSERKYLKPQVKDSENRAKCKIKNVSFFTTPNFTPNFTPNSFDKGMEVLSPFLYVFEPARLCRLRSKTEQERPLSALDTPKGGAFVKKWRKNEVGKESNKAEHNCSSKIKVHSAKQNGLFIAKALVKMSHILFISFFQHKM